MIKAYTRTTKAQIKSLIASIDASEGYPSGTTLTHCDYILNNGKYIIHHDSIIEKFLGVIPKDFDYIEPILN